MRNAPTNLATAAKDKYIEQLSKYTKAQLLEMKVRQQNLLSNKSRLVKLPDKGERIQKLYDKIVEEINGRNEVDQAAVLFSELNIVEKGVKVVTHMEWNGRNVSADQMLVAAETLDSDDDEDEVDLLKIIAQSRNTKLVKVVKPPKSLITEADIREIKSIESQNETNKLENVQCLANTSTNTSSDETDANKSSESIELEPHAINMIRMDKAFDKSAIIKQKFLPFRTTKTDVHSIENEKQRKPCKNWEMTAATPPIIRNSAVQMLTLQESIEVEKQHKEKLRDEMEKQAEERLTSRQQIIADNISLLPPGSALMNPNSFFQSYRQRETHFNENEAEDEPYSDNSDNDDEPDMQGMSIVITE